MPTWAYQRRHEVAKTLQGAINAGLCSDWELGFAASIIRKVAAGQASSFTSRQIARINDLLTKAQQHGVSS